MIPAIRRELAAAMKKKGMDQKSIAKLLNITEAAVSQYTNKKRASGFELEKSVKNEIEVSSDLIISGKSDVLREVQRILLLPKMKMKICEIHKSKGADKNCRVCFVNG